MESPCWACDGSGKLSTAKARVSYGKAGVDLDPGHKVADPRTGRFGQVVRVIGNPGSFQAVVKWGFEDETLVPCIGHGLRVVGD